MFFRIGSKSLPILAFPVALTLCGTSLGQGHAHVHGIAKIGIAADANELTVSLDSPLDNFLGFEHPPSGPAEVAAADALKKELSAPGPLIVIDPQAGCVLRSVDLQSAALGLGNRPPDTDGHADIDATFSYVCSKAAAAHFVDFGFMAKYSRIQRIEVEGATQSGQFARELVRPEHRVEF